MLSGSQVELILIMFIYRRLYRRDFYAAAGLLGLYLGLVVLADLTRPGGPQDWILHADVLARYTLVIPVAFLTALALGQQAAQARSDHRICLAANLRWVALSFALYSVTQAFVTRLDLFPANYLNSASFLSLNGVPIPVLRAVLAIIITIGLIQAIQAVDNVRQAQFLNVQQSRLEALEQARRDLVEREALRHELLRHTVIAQEDERARIARELHDETAQILSAFTLNLAALRDSLPKNFKASETLLQMQKLSLQMSVGIYRLVHDLRPAQLDDLLMKGLA
ncbi:MAG TPA: histidine kinase [Anaerolineales bacterium]